MKETTLLIVDLSKDFFEEDKKKLKIALNIVVMISGSNIIHGHKTDDIGLMFLNTKNSNEKSIELFSEFG